LLGIMPASLAAMMLAGLPVPDQAVEGLAELVRAVGADDLADRLEHAVVDGVALLALTLDESAPSCSLRWKTRRPS
jgi:hypothetical protein